MSKSQWWWPAHVHSSYSVLDGIADVKAMVHKAALDGRPAMALTDHGNMGGVTQLYKACKAEGIAPFPGVEAYLIDPTSVSWESPKRGEKIGRFHVGLLALDTKGYQGLVQLVSLTHTRPRFNRFPRLTLTDMAEFANEYGDHIALTTGCYFGLVQQTLIKEGDAAALRIVQMYSQWFPHTYIELQNHNIKHDDDPAGVPTTDTDLNVKLLDLANISGLPVLATQDSHYLDTNHKPAHSMMKRMVYGGAEDEFPGDSFHFASADWMEEHYPRRWWQLAEEGSRNLLEANEVVIPYLDKFTVHMPHLTRNPYKQIKDSCEQVVPNTPRYLKRLDYELSVIKDLDIAGYFVLMQTCVEWCHQHGYTIEARGSANGSLVCYLLGVTQVDPIEWGTMFERFLSRDRIKPPDIDMDIEDEARGPLIRYLQRTFDSIQIGTWSQLGVRDEDGKGSIMVSYLSHLRRKAVEDSGGDKKLGAIRFAQRHGHIKTIADVKDADDHEGLSALSKVEAYRSYGVHAGGILVSGSDAKISDWIPSMLVASSDTKVTQFDQDAVEEWGFLKMDWLGQATLRTMRLCQEMIGRADPTDFSWIPKDDGPACKLLREGRTDTGIFHFEGYTKSKGGRELGVRSTKDAVLVQALYMPGAMDTGQKDLYIHRRRDPEARARVKYIHPVFEDALKETYGAVVFQEQVLSIMRGLGMSIEGINKFFKVVKDSGKGAVERNVERLSEVRKEFDELCAANGITNTDEAWGQTAGFVAYGFNRGHAAGYGIRSYRCAYLKAHYPLEFMTALLQTWAGDKKEKLYIREARRMGIRILPPDVNVSGVLWTIDRKRKAIRKGLISIPGIGMAAADDIAHHAPYTSIGDMVNRCSGRTMSGGKLYLNEGKIAGGNLLKLYEAGALASIYTEPTQAQS